MHALLIPNGTQGYNKTLTLICIVFMLLLAAGAFTELNTAPCGCFLRNGG